MLQNVPKVCPKEASAVDYSECEEMTEGKEGGEAVGGQTYADSAWGEVGGL